MAQDYEDLDDLEHLSDSELRGVVRSRLAEHPGLDADDITVHVHEGAVRLIGRVGTDAEIRMADHLVTDVLGLSDVTNELVLDPIRRGESPEAIDDHLADEEEHAGALLGDRPVPFSPEAEHLEEDLDAMLYGTTDVHESIERATPWVPPDQPTPEGQ